MDKFTHVNLELSAAELECLDSTKFLIKIDEKTILDKYHENKEKIDGDCRKYFKTK